MLETWLRANFKVQSITGNNAAMLCPLHKEKKASFYINVNTGKWKCHSKCGGGQLKTLCSRAHVDPPGEEEQAAPAREQARKYVPDSLIKAAVERLSTKAAKDAVSYLEKRGVTRQTMKKFHLGYGEDGRVWIPVFDHQGFCINVRRYDWTKLETAKFLNYAEGYGEAVIWPAGIVEREDEVIIFEGELDTLVAQSLGLDNAVTSTGGAGTWTDSFSRALAGKSVLICYDIDDAGRQGAALVARKLSVSASRVAAVQLPITQPKNGDFTDYALAVKFDRRTVHDLFGGYRVAQAPASRVHFSKLADADPDPARLLKLRSVVSGKDLTPFNVPAQVVVHCVPDDKAASCRLCPLKGFGGRAEISIPVTSKPVLQSVMATDRMVDVAIATHCEIPNRCPGNRISVSKTIPLWDLRLSADVDSGEEEGAEGSRRAFSMANLVTNQPYDMELSAVSDPKTQYSLLHIVKAETSHTALDAWTSVGKEKLLALWEP